MRRGLVLSVLAVLVAGAGLPATAAPPPATQTYSATQTIPVPPASHYAGAGGGDGWAVAMTPTAVYNVFHHDGQLQVACHAQSDASPCWSPKTITDGDGGDFATSGQPGLLMDPSTGRLYVYATRVLDSTAGVVCVDTDQPAEVADPFCGFTPLSGVGDAPLDGGISVVGNPVAVGSRWYAFNFVDGSSATGSRNRLLCFDLGTKAPCAAQPYGVGQPEGGLTAGSFPPPAVAAIGSDVIVPFTGPAGGSLACFDGVAQHPCAGAWPAAAPGYPSTAGAPLPTMDAAGAVTGLCLPTGADPCYDLTGHPAPTPAGLPAAVPATSGWNGPAFTLGARVWVPDGNTDSVDCYDYATGAGCPSFPKRLDDLGLLYTVNPDPQRPTCIWVNADNGGSQIQNFDAYTGGPCGAGPIRVLASRLVAPDPACTPLSYSSLRVVSPPRSAYAGGSVTFLDGDATPIGGVADRPLDAAGSVDLSGLHLNSATGLPQFLVTLAGAGGAPTSVTVQLTWTGTPDPRCTPTGAPAGPQYVGLGDSYSAGEGLPPFQTRPVDTDTDRPYNRCHRSVTGSYEDQVRPTAVGRTFRACSGAVIGDFTHPSAKGYVGEPPQEDSITAGTRWITMTFGGNDLGFADVFKNCLLVRGTLSSPLFSLGVQTYPFGRAACAKALTNAETGLAGLEPRLESLYTAALQRSGNHAQIRVLTYPPLLPDSFRGDSGQCAVAGPFVDPFVAVGVSARFSLDLARGDVLQLVRGERLLDDDVDQAVARVRGRSADFAARLRAVDAVAAYTDPDGRQHTVACGDRGRPTPWINGLGITPAEFLKLFHVRLVGGTIFTAPTVVVQLADGNAFKNLVSGSFHPTAEGQRHLAQATEATW